ncbi:MAG: hydrogenase expression/formation protein HypE [Burkholderiales bacterium]|nr:hydrogenase expression/formation protein HypE [Burkholderiales bacterium]
MSEKKYVRPLNFKTGRVEMNYGAGGKATAQLISDLFAEAFSNEYLLQGNDGADLPQCNGRLVMSTDSHVVTPLFFAGGDIGSLSVHGTVNDVAVCGAKPLYMSAGFILEEGFPLSDLKRIVESMANAAKEAGIYIVTGDTKVVEKGKGDGVYINTTGLGVIPNGISLSGAFCKPGDVVAVSGDIGDHGVAVMSERVNLGFETNVKSDTASLNRMTEALVKNVPSLRCMRDPTRGGLGNTLNEIAKQSGVGIEIREEDIPVKENTLAACEFLGLDPLYTANEGKLIAFCAEKDADKMLETMKADPLGKNAKLIGKCIEDEDHFVQMVTAFGGIRMVDWLTGEQLPRIC